jgi:putative peptidoglycan lipid II flippase
MTELGSTGRRQRLLRSMASVSAITMGSRVLGLVREQVRAALLGTSIASDAFGIAFQIPNLLRRLVAEGAMSAGFIPVLSEQRQQGGEDAARDFTVRFLNLSLLALTVISAVGALGAGLVVAAFVFVGGREVSVESQVLTTDLTRWMFPYIALVSWAAIAQGVLNTYRVFWVSAMTSVLLNIAIIGCALGFAAHLEQPVYGFAIGVLVGGALQLGFQLPFVYRLGYRWRPKLSPGPAVRKALWLLVPTLFGAGVYQINVLVSQAIAWSLGGGAVSSLQYSGRLLELTLGVFAVAVSTVVLPSLAADAAAGSLERVRETVLYSVRLCAFVCFPVTIGLFLLRTETASLLFERGAYSAESTQSTAYALGFHIIGLTHIALARVFVPVFYAFKDTKTPVYVAGLSMVVNVALCYALAGPLGHGGIALANTASAFVQAFALAALLSRHTGPLNASATARSVGISLGATLVMGGIVWLGQDMLNTRELAGFGELVLPYAGLLVAAFIGYFIPCALLGHPELAEFVALANRRAGRS